MQLGIKETGKDYGKVILCSHGSTLQVDRYSDR